eukprot:CAMPEP_0181090824 /NCGR_PEP_ID=MMETSP1071-20121207/8070_1 /TAXON_ID=35127 /ORGANISM="Thalassiosira sp., Strain NH16" /LENGTH=196 /DNA_ID=CAMNT_0023172921 /DNA_START=49 /DNA_END=636 /DNA_ORIENTATION=-
MSRQIGQATLFYRLSVKGKNATTLSPEEAAALTSNLTPSSRQLVPDDTANDSNLSFRKSWKVGEDEHVIQVDASSLHMSAAQRLFGGKVQKQAPSAITEEDVDEFIATIDDTPLHRSAALRMFGGTAGKKKPVHKGKQETPQQKVEAHNEEEVETSEVTEDEPHRVRQDKARNLDAEWESTRNLGVEWTYFWSNVF